MTSRRQVLLGIAASTVVAPEVSVAQAGLPFCCFSAVRGWSERQVDRTIYARRAGHTDRSGIPQVIASIERAIGIQASVDVYITNNREGNAYATTAGGRRILIADTDFLVSCNTDAGSDWAAIQVIAHEVGHFIAGFDAMPHVKELNADYWSGFALNRLQCPIGSSAIAVAEYGDEEDTATHPDKYRRQKMILAGWTDASRNDPNYDRCGRCGPV